MHREYLLRNWSWICFIEAKFRFGFFCHWMWCLCLIFSFPVILPLYANAIGKYKQDFLRHMLNAHSSQYIILLWISQYTSVESLYLGAVQHFFFFFVIIIRNSSVLPWWSSASAPLVAIGIECCFKPVEWWYGTVYCSVEKQKEISTVQASLRNLWTDLKLASLSRVCLEINFLSCGGQNDLALLESHVMLYMYTMTDQVCLYFQCCKKYSGNQQETTVFGIPFLTVVQTGSYSLSFNSIPTEGVSSSSGQIASFFGLKEQAKSLSK